MSEASQEVASQQAHIEIAADNMSAYLIFENPISEANTISNDEVNRLIKDAKITFGIKYSEILEICEGKKEGCRFLIAEGTPPVTGTDASLEFYFDTESSFRPKILADGHIDYKEVNLLKSAVKDSILIKKIPATQGIKGKNIFGFELFALQGKNLDITLGSGVYRNKSDQNLIMAGVDGVILYDDKKKSIEVQPLYVVQKSVDYSTGNINVKSSVEIKGDVKPYFTINTPYSVQVHGSVDNATITCGGALSIAGGIVGDGKLQIRSGGDVHVSYINNHNIRCHSSVYVNNEIRNSAVEAGNEVILVKGAGIIIGGKVSAANKIIASYAGNRYSVHTELEAGVRLEFKDKYFQKDAERKAIQKKYDELKAELTRAESDTNEGNFIPGLTAKLAECVSLIEKLNRDLKEIETDYYNVPNPVIQIKDKVYPGVIIKIKYATYEVKEELSRVDFRLEGGEVKWG